MAFMSIASVTLMPLNPNSFFNNPLTAFGDNEVAYFGRSSIAGTDKCATIIDAIPASINALKGANSRLSNSAFDL